MDLCDDIVPLNQVRARFTALAEDARNGRAKVITRNGESYVAIVDARKLDYYHRLEREVQQLSALRDVVEGLERLKAGEAGADPAAVRVRLQDRVKRATRG